MKRWWVRPLVRTISALVLPIVVPVLLTLLLWALPGDPASIVCPPENCTGTDALAERWNLDQGPIHFFTEWLTAALGGELGNSWRMQTGASVSNLVFESIPHTLALIGLAFIPILLGTVLAALDVVHRRLDPLLYLLGLFPAVILAVMAAAWKVLTYSEFGGETAALFLGAAVLGNADGAFSGAVTGTRSVSAAERQQRYTGVGVLRGETEPTFFPTSRLLCRPASGESCTSSAGLWSSKWSSRLMGSAICCGKLRWSRTSVSCCR